MKNRLFLLLGVLFLASCGSDIKDNVVVDEIKENASNMSPQKYVAKLKTTSGEVSFYTDYKYEVGDTLISVYEFTDNREAVVKKLNYVIDSLDNAHRNLLKENEKLKTYNDMLMDIIKENAQE